MSRLHYSICSLFTFFITLVGTLEGFSFDSEDEADKQTVPQADETEGAEPQTNGKGRRKAEKTSVCLLFRGCGT